MVLVEPEFTEIATGTIPSNDPKVTIMSFDDEDDGCCTFGIRDEDHTLGIALRYIIQKNPAVTFCGYSIPHPSESVINLRIQTDGTISAVDVLRKSVEELRDLAVNIKSTFVQKMADFKEIS